MTLQMSSIVFYVKYSCKLVVKLLLKSFLKIIRLYAQLLFDKWMDDKYKFVQF